MATFGPTNPGRDTVLLELAPTANFGARTTLRTSWAFSGQKSNGLLAWDVSSIPVGATVTSATLSLVTQATTLVSPQACKVYPLTSVFDEGTENGGTTNSGATWQKRLSAANGGTFWDTNGGDYDVLYWSAFAAPTTVSTVNIDVRVPLQKALGSYRSSGFVSLIVVPDEILGSNEVWDYWSRDAPTPANRPTLTITYSVDGGSLPLLGVGS